MIDHPTTIYLSGGIKREGFDHLVIEHVVRYTRGGYPKRVFLNNVIGLDGDPVSQGYDLNTGTYRTVFKVEPETNPDVDVPFKVKGSYIIEGEKYPTPFEHSEELRIPEPALLIKSSSFRFHDDKLIVTLKVERTNGKIPEFAYLDNEAKPTGNLISNKVLTQTYNPIDGILVATYQAKSRAMYADMEYSSEVRSLPDQPGTVVSFNGRLERTKTINYKVISKVLKERTLRVMMEVKWADTNLPPSSFSLDTPFLYGNNVPTGIVKPNSINYDPHTGLYEFDIVVGVIPEGTLNYNFITKAKGENYPPIDFNLSVDYDHQSTYKAELVSTTLGDNTLQARFKVASKEDSNYLLQNLHVPPADFVSHLIGSAAPRLNWIEGSNEFIATWEVVVDNSRELHYNLRGHFIIDNKMVPWFVEATAKPIAIFNEAIIRNESDRMDYSFSLVSNEKIVSIDATSLCLLINRIPSSNNVVQKHDTNPNIVNGFFILNEQKEEAVEVELIGTALVETNVLRKIPLHIKTVDYINIPTGEGKIDFTVIEHTVIGGIEKAVFEPKFEDGSSPANMVMVSNKVEVNGKSTGIIKSGYHNGRLTILTKVETTGFKETHTLKGKVYLAGYRDNPEYDFESSTTFGSDSFPVSLKTNAISVIKNSLNFNLGIVLKNGEIPPSVKITSVVLGENVKGISNLRRSESYDPETGNLNFAVDCEYNQDAKLNYGLDLKLRIETEDGTHDQWFKLLHTEEPKLKVNVEYLGYELKNGNLVLSYQLRSTRPSSAGVKINSLTKEASNFIYNDKTGIITHTLPLKDANGVMPFDVNFEVRVIGTSLTVEAKTGQQYYAPAATASYLGHEFTKSGTLIYKWQFKDASGKNPKFIRIDDFFKNNINTKVRTIDLIYDRQTGIGYVEVIADKKRRTSYYADAKFRFPSPDPLYYPLVIDLKTK